MLKARTLATIKPQYSYPNEYGLIYVVLTDEEKGRVDITPYQSILRFPPIHVALVEWLEPLPDQA